MDILIKILGLICFIVLIVDNVFWIPSSRKRSNIHSSKCADKQNLDIQISKDDYGNVTDMYIYEVDKSNNIRRCLKALHGDAAWAMAQSLIPMQQK